MFDRLLSPSLFLSLFKCINFYYASLCVWHQEALARCSCKKKKKKKSFMFQAPSEWKKSPFGVSSFFSQVVNARTVLLCDCFESLMMRPKRFLSWFGESNFFFFCHDGLKLSGRGSRRVLSADERRSSCPLLKRWTPFRNPLSAPTHSAAVSSANCQRMTAL